MISGRGLRNHEVGHRQLHLLLNGGLDPNRRFDFPMTIIIESAQKVGDGRDGQCRDMVSPGEGTASVHFQNTDYY